MVEHSPNPGSTTPEYDALAAWVLEIAGASNHKREVQQMILATVLKGEGQEVMGDHIKAVITEQMRTRGYSDPTISTYINTSYGRLRNSAVNGILEIHPETGAKGGRGREVSQFTRARLSHVLPDFNAADEHFFVENFGDEVAAQVLLVKARLDAALTDMGAAPADLPNIDKKIQSKAPPKGKPGRKPKRKGHSQADRESAAWARLEEIQQEFLALSPESQHEACFSYLDEMFVTKDDQQRAARVLRFLLVNKRTAATREEIFSIAFPEEDIKKTSARKIGRIVRSAYLGLNKAAEENLVENRQLRGDEGRPIRVDAGVARKVLEDLLVSSPEKDFHDKWKALGFKEQEARCYELFTTRSEGGGGYTHATSKILARILQSEEDFVSAGDVDRYLLLSGEDSKKVSSMDLAKRRLEHRQIINRLLRRDLLGVEARKGKAVITINPREAKVVLGMLLKLNLSDWATPPSPLPQEEPPQVIRIATSSAYDRGLLGAHPSDPPREAPSKQGDREISVAPSKRRADLLDASFIPAQAGNLEELDVNAVVDQLDDDGHDDRLGFFGDAVAETPQEERLERIKAAHQRAIAKGLFGGRGEK